MASNVITYYLDCLVREEANVLATEEEVSCCLEAVEQHKDRIRRLRAALEVLGVESKDLQSTQ